MFKNSKIIASLGSPSTTTDFNLDILSSSDKDRLVGSMLYIQTEQEGLPVVVTGQVTSIKMRNRYHENDLFKGVIKTDGFIPHLSGSQDLKVASFSVGAVFSKKDDYWNSEVLGNVPPTGTQVKKINQNVVDDLVKQHEDAVMHFGTAYGDNDVSIPMFLKHFGSPETGGYGEAHHSLVVGRTGSGKSTLVKMMLAGYARHDDLGFIIIDPKGEFSEELEGISVGANDLDLKGVLTGLNRESYRVGISQIQLETWDLFREILLSVGMHKDLSVNGGDNAEELFLAFEDILRNSFKLTDLSHAGVLDFILREIVNEDNDYATRIYKTPEPRERMIRMLTRVLENKDHRARKTWNFVAFLFSKGSEGNERRSLKSIISRVIASQSGKRPIVSIDLSIPGNKRDLEQLIELDDDDDKELYTSSLQKKILYRLITDLRKSSEFIFTEKNRSGSKETVNTMVVFEEAHRFVPRHNDSDDDDGKKLTKKIIECVRETRKYGLAFKIIDQTIGGINREIVQQIRSFWVGFGLSMGNELDSLKEIIGGDDQDMSLYQSFKDPASYASPKDKKFPWLAFGPVSPLVSNRAIFINAYSGTYFTEYNSLPVDSNYDKIHKPKPLDKKNNSGINKKLKKPDLSKGKLKVSKNTSLNDLSSDDLDIFGD